MDNCTSVSSIPPNIVTLSIDIDFSDTVVAHRPVPPTVTPCSCSYSAGPLLLGYFFNWCLYGVLCIQVYIYYLAFPLDNRFNKFLVYAIFAVETTQTVLITHDSFHSFAIGYGNINVLNSAQLEWIAIPIMSGIVSMVVQIYYGYRLSILSGSRSLGLTISAIALTQGSAAITQGVQAFKIGNFRDLASKAFVSCAIWLTMSAACDLIIAASMTYILLRKDTRLASTHAAVSRAIRIIVETGCLTAMAATVHVTLFLAVRDKPYFAGAALILAKLYSNSFLVIFNSRIRIVGGRNSASTAAFMDPSISLGDIRSKNVVNRVPLPMGHDNNSRDERSVGTLVIRKEVEMWTDAGTNALDDQRSYKSDGGHRASIGSSET